MKYVVVSGGVVSGLGKGITASSIGTLLKGCGLSVTSIKIDPYLNIDAGTMSPYEHGEVYVLDDGGEVDLDLGNYERFMNIHLTRDHNITTGKVYQQVLSKERQGKYLGKTVQIIPHVTDCIQEWIERVAEMPVEKSGNTPEVCIIELGGTVGDIESSTFLEALRQFSYKSGRDNLCHIHVSLVPMGTSKEQKTKPTQHSIINLRASGLMPDLLVCRCEKEIEDSIKSKISMFSMVPYSNVISVHNVSNIYKVPAMLLEQNVPSIIMNCLRINRNPQPDMGSWNLLSMYTDHVSKHVSIAIVGKYTGLEDSYISLHKALRVACIYSQRRLVINYVESSNLEDKVKKDDQEVYEKAWATIKCADGILIPGGFGIRGVEGKILAAQYARENKVPFLGICLGMQIMVIEYARNVCGLEKANSSEFDEKTKHPVVMFMPEIDQAKMGGTMRLGARICDVKKLSLAHRLYNKTEITERHRHRYEINPLYIEQLESAGLIFSGKDQKGERMEITELPDSMHPFYFGCQFHPEFTSRPQKPSPCFIGLAKASSKQLDWNKLPGSPSWKQMFSTPVSGCESKNEVDYFLPALPQGCGSIQELADEEAFPGKGGPGALRINIAQE